MEMSERRIASKSLESRCEGREGVGHSGLGLNSTESNILRAASRLSVSASEASGVRSWKAATVSLLTAGRAASHRALLAASRTLE